MTTPPVAEPVKESVSQRIIIKQTDKPEADFVAEGLAPFAL
jgi:hypothetical protein